MATAKCFAGVGVLVVAVTSAASALAGPQLEGEPRRTTAAGYAELKWTEGESSEYELQRATTETFLEPVVIYRGPDRGTFVSGMKDGTYYYRIRGRSEESWSTWSDPVTLEVEHWSQARALGLMSLGAVVFLLTAGLIVTGHLRRDEDTL